MKTNKLVYILLILFIGSFLGCQEDFLEEETYTIVVPGTFWKTDADAKAAVTSVYNRLISGEDTYKRFIWMGAELPGEAANNNNGGGTRGEMNDFTWNPNTDFCLRIWRGLYVGIRNANNVLLNIDNVDFKNPDLKPIYIAETKFLRALFYLDLVRFYDHVAYITETENFDAINVSNENTDDLVWALIESDLEFAEANLPDKQTGVNAGRASKGTAKALLTRVYATEAGYPWNKSGYWAKAVSKAEELMNNESVYGYGLETDFAKNFDVKNEFGIEQVFSANFQSGAGWGNDRAALTGIRGMNIKATDGWSSIVSDEPFYRTYAVSDMRREKTFMLHFTDVKSGVYQFYDPDDPNATIKTCHFGKYQDPNDISVGTGDFGCNQPIIRYSDILLLHSEAENEANGPSDKAVTGINRVRERAGLVALESTLSQDELRQAIIQERVWEFAGEAQVFFDYKRQHCISERVKVITDKFYVLPVCQNELDVNPLLVQHPLWR